MALNIRGMPPHVWNAARNFIVSEFTGSISIAAERIFAYRTLDIRTVATPEMTQVQWLVMRRPLKPLDCNVYAKYHF